MIRAVIFDMDGLMFDTESAYSVVQTAMSERRGKQFTNDLKVKLMGKRAREVMVELSRFFGRDEEPEALMREQDEELIAAYRISVAKMPGLDELLTYLRCAGIRRCIGTSSRRFLVDMLLERHELTHEFEFVVSGDMVTRGKPDPEIYNACVWQLGVPPDACLVLEDSRNGTLAGDAAGCRTCAIPSVYTRDEDFSTADIVCDSLTDPRLLSFIA